MPERAPLAARARLGERLARVPVWHLALIVAVTSLAYAGSFDGGWVSDDTEYVVESPLIRSLAPSNLWAIFTTHRLSNYMPLTELSLAVDYRLWGLWPPGFHLTSLLLHVANAIAVWALVRRFGHGAGFALTVALLWAAHPLQVESVAWVSERKNVLSTLCFLLAFHAWLGFSERPRPGLYAAVVVLFTCALLAKVNTVVLPAVVLAYEVIVRGRLRSRDIAAVVPLLAIGAVLGWWHVAGSATKLHGGHWHGGDMATTLRTSVTVIPGYLMLALVPTRLSPFYSVPLRASWLDGSVLAGLLTIGGLAALAIHLAVRRREEAFWIVWFGVTLSPMLNFIPFPTFMHDRFLYVPLVGLFVPLVSGATALLRRAAAPAWLGPAATGLAVSACTGLTIARVPVFHDPMSLRVDGLLKFPYIAADRPFRPAPLDNELRALSEAIARDPASAVLHNNIGALKYDGSKLLEAVAALERARELDAGDPVIALNLGRAYLWAGRVEEALPMLEEAARLEPPSYYAQLNLVRVYAGTGDFARARVALDRAAHIRPDGTELPTERARVAMGSAP